MSMLVVLNNFIRKRTITKSTDEDQILVMDRLLNRTGGQGYIYCSKVVLQLQN